MHNVRKGVEDDGERQREKTERAIRDRERDGERRRETETECDIVCCINDDCDCLY